MLILNEPIFHRPLLAIELIEYITSADASSGLFLAAPRRTGKTTFIKEDLVPSLREAGAVVIYADLWEDQSINPAIVITNAIRQAIVDNNGNYTYSKTIMVNVDIKGISVMVVYPNPFSTRVQIRVNADKAEKVAINIINSNGVLMSTQNAQTQVGDNNITINKVDALPGGVYYIEVVSSTRSLKTKVMKLN